LAFQKVCSDIPYAKLTFAGGGPLENEMKKLAHQLGIDKHVEFKGWQNPEQIRALLKATDVFVHPSITTDQFDMESTTVAIMEAMAMELPILSTWHSGIPELVEHGVNGLLAQEKDIDSYAQHMKALLNWGPQPQNRAKIIQSFSKEIHLQKLENYYFQALI
jgi:colanic acid/amylovoran biosynthesis glycosyltransferase